MRIAFVQDILGFSIPLGITIIAGALRKDGHEVDLFVVDNKLEKTLHQLALYKPDIIGFSVISGSHQGYINIARAIKKRLNIPILWGGPHVTFFPKIIEEDYADVVCVGEGDKQKIFNLRCLFSLLTHHPKLLGFVRPLFSLRFKKLFWWIGYALDGYYLRKGLAYKQGVKEFFSTVMHYLTNYCADSDLK